jgi:hypothetical protein
MSFPAGTRQAGLAGSPGVSDHGLLTGLTDLDHPQYEGSITPDILVDSATAVGGQVAIRDPATILGIRGAPVGGVPLTVFDGAGVEIARFVSSGGAGRVVLNGVSGAEVGGGLFGNGLNALSGELALATGSTARARVSGTAAEAAIGGVPVSGDALALYHGGALTHTFDLNSGYGRMRLNNQADTADALEAYFDGVKWNVDSTVFALHLGAVGSGRIQITPDGELGFGGEAAVGIGSTFHGQTPGRVRIDGSGGVGNITGLTTGDASRYFLGHDGTQALLRSTSSAPLHLGTNSTTRMQIAAAAAEAAIGGAPVTGSTLSLVAGSGTAMARAGGTLDSQFADAGNVGAGEDDLHTYTIPANTLATNGKAIKYRAHFTIQTTGGATKQVRVKLGATTIFDSTAQAIGVLSEWVVELMIVRTGATSQRVSAIFNASGGGNTPVSYTTAAETLSGALVLKATGQSAGGGEANNDIVQHLSLVEFVG